MNTEPSNDQSMDKLKLILHRSGYEFVVASVDKNLVTLRVWVEDSDEQTT